MNRRSPCDCEHCTQNRLYRQKEVTRLYSERSPMHVSRGVDRKAAALVTLLLFLACLGVVANWWVHR